MFQSPPVFIKIEIKDSDIRIGDLMVERVRSVSIINILLTTFLLR